MPASSQRKRKPRVAILALPREPTALVAAVPQASAAPPVATPRERTPSHPPPREPPWAYSPPEAARLAGVSERTVWTWIKDKKVHAVRVGGVTRIGAASLRELLGLSS
jgi:excisionase family DNA binding protein